MRPATAKAVRLALWRAQSGHCYLCGRSLNYARLVTRGAPPLARPDDPTIDHRRPRSRGGTDDPANLALACFRCNVARGADESWRPPPGWRPGDHAGLDDAGLERLIVESAALAARWKARLKAHEAAGGPPRGSRHAAAREYWHARRDGLRAWHREFSRIRVTALAERSRRRRGATDESRAALGYLLPGSGWLDRPAPG